MSKLGSYVPVRSLIVPLLGLVGVLLCLTVSAAQAQMLQIDNAPAKPATGAAPTTDDDTSPHSLALRARWVTVPGWQLSPYTDAHTQLNGGWSIGAEYLYRMRAFDVVISLDYSWLNPDSGNYLATNHDPATDTHFLNFDKLSSLSVDVSLIGHWNLTPWLELRAGGGLGIGGVFGNIYQITNNSGCTLGNASDTTKCYPRPIGPITVLDDATSQRLISGACNPDLSNSTKDTPGSPCYRRVDTYPMNVRVVPVLNAMLGFRFRAHRNVYIHLETGWRLVGWFLGAGPEFRF
jgi:hypothetical protein